MHIWNRIDWRVIPVALLLMIISLLVISSMTAEPDERFFTPLVKSQIRWFLLGWTFFGITTCLNYQKLKSTIWILYFLSLLLLIGLFLAPPIQHVHRWYRIPSLNMTLQPSETAKLIVILALASFLESRRANRESLWTALQAGAVVGIPFLLILKQPDLGTAIILFSIALSMCYFAGLHRGVIRVLTAGGVTILMVVLLLFIGIIPHERARPFFTLFMKDYQYERLNPKSYHLKAATTAIGVGGLTGTGWKKGTFAGKKWLPAAHTDSVFAAYGEEFGFLGLLFLLSLFFGLIYFSLQVATVAKDPFGRLLAIGLATYLAMHVLLNIAMMCALLPISGVPLIFVTYGGSSILTTLTALGLLQSIYSRRFMF